MLKRLWMVALIGLVALGCGGDDSDDGAAGTGGDDAGGVPAEFADLSNPLAGDADAATAGEGLYTMNCANCHGPAGAGDGQLAGSLDPVPTSLVDGTAAGWTDGYFFWRIAKGGGFDPYNSSMPAYEASLDETQTWQIITWLRNQQ